MSEEALAQVTTQLGVIAEDEGLEWTMDGQASRVAPAVLALEAKADDRASLIRLVQVLCLDPGLPEAKRRASYRMVADAIRAAGAQTLTQGDPGLRWAQVVAAVALERVAVRGGLREAWCLLQAEFSGSRLVSRLHNAIESNGPLGAALPGRRQDPSQDPLAELQTLKMSGGKKKISTLIDLDGLSAISMNATGLMQVVREHIYPAILALNDNLQAMSASVGSHVSALTEHTLALEIQLRAASSRERSFDRELQALWWGQSLYSRSRRCSYRDLSGPERLYTMAEDLLDVWGPDPDEALVAWYVETAMRLDERGVAELEWRTLALGLPNAAYGTTPPALREEPTALPISTLLASERPRDAEAADAIWSSAGLEEMKGRALLRQLFRERQLARWVMQGGA